MRLTNKLPKRTISNMDRDDFLTKKRLPVRRGQKWTLREPWHAKQLPRNIEIIEVKELPSEIADITTFRAYKCKIKEFHTDERHHRSYSLAFGRVSDDELTQFMWAGDILTYYEQV